MRPLLHTSRNSSGCTDSVPCPTSEFEITTPACTTSPGAISYFRRGVMHLRYMRVSVSSTDSKRHPGRLLQDRQHALGQVEVVQAPVAIRQHGTHIAVEGAQHAPLFLALQPGVDVAVEQGRLLGSRMRSK
jgi:hypothetical protein